jgi:hypothetical protein
MKARIPTAVALSLTLILSAHAQVPGIINYQGRIVDNGTNFNGTGQFKFALVSNTGTTNYWSNDGTAVGQPTLAVPLTVNLGLYSVLLGDTTISNMTVAIPMTVFTNSDVRLRVWFTDGTAGFQRLLPDQRIAAVGFSLMSANVPDGSITSNKLAAGAVGPSALAAGLMLGPGCYIVRAGNNLSFGANIQGWANAITNGDAAYVIGGSYNLTNTIFNWAGLSGVTVCAIAPQITDVFTYQPNGFGWLINLIGATNFLVLGDWNARCIFTSTYPPSVDAAIVDGDAGINITVDGMHAQLEREAQPNPGGQDKALIFVSGAQNIILKNLKIGCRNNYPGGETNWLCSPWVSAFHGNPVTNVTFVSCVFYGDVWHGFSVQTNEFTIYNCWALDESSIFSGWASFEPLYGSCGSFDTNENNSYWLPGTPPQQMSPVPYAGKRTPPDWNVLAQGGSETLTNATIDNATVVNLTVSNSFILNGVVENFVVTTNLMYTVDRTNCVVYCDTTANSVSNIFQSGPSGTTPGQTVTFENIGTSGNAVIIDVGSGHSLTNSGSRYLTLTNMQYATVQRGAVAPNWAVIGGNVFLPWGSTFGSATISRTNLVFTTTVGGTNYSYSLPPTSHSP